MKLELRPLKGEAFQVEAVPADTVADFKAKVAGLRPELPVTHQKLLFAGKVLQDGKTLEDCGVNDGDFLVIMSKPPKAAAPDAGAQAAAASAPTPAPAAGLGAPAPAAAAPPAVAGAVGGPAAAATVQMLCEMGFPRSDVERALRAAFNNPDRAVEYLMSGIPPHLMALAEGHAPPPAAANAPGAAGGGAGLPGMPAPGAMPPAFGTQAPAAGPLATGPLAKLQNDPMFFRLRAAVQQNPASLNQVLNFIHKSNPDLITLIAEHQEEFVELLQEQKDGGGGGAAQDPVQAMLAALQQAQQTPVATSGTSAAAPAAPMPAAHQAGAAVPAPTAQAPAAATAGAAALTEAEQQAVSRLQALGFDRESVVQAFLACEKNEELAANYLFDNGGDDN